MYVRTYVTRTVPTNVHTGRLVYQVRLDIYVPKCGNSAVWHVFVVLALTVCHCVCPQELQEAKSRVSRLETTQEEMKLLRQQSEDTELANKQIRVRLSVCGGWWWGVCVCASVNGWMGVRVCVYMQYNVYVHMYEHMLCASFTAVYPSVLLI